MVGITSESSRFEPGGEGVVPTAVAMGIREEGVAVGFKRLGVVWIFPFRLPAAAAASGDGPQPR